MIRQLLAATFLAFFLLPRLNAQQRVPYEFKHLTQREGLPSNAIYDIFLDSRRLLWFTSENGVTRFDGHFFEAFDVSLGLADNEVFKAIEDSKGRVWFGSFNGRLSYFDTKSNKMHSYRQDSTLQKLKGGSYLSDIVEDPTDGSVWFCFEQRYIKRLFADGSVKDYSNQESSHFTLFVNDSQQLVAAGSEFWYFNRAKDRFDNFTTNLLIQKMPSVAVANSGKYYYEDELGIYEFRQQQVRLIVPKAMYGQGNLHSITADKSGNLWLGVVNGVHQFDVKSGKVLRFFKTQAPVTKVIRDHENNQWICTAGDGVYFFPSGYEHITYLNTANGLASAEVTCVARFTEGVLAVATYPSTINFVSDGGDVLHKVKIHSSREARINHIWLKDNALWVQVNNRQIVNLPNFVKNFRQIESIKLTLAMNRAALGLSGSLPLNTILLSTAPHKNMLFSRDGKIYIATTGVLELTPDPKKKGNFRYRYLYKEERHRIYALAESADGTIWFGGTEGVGFFHPNDSAAQALSLEFESTVNDIVSLPNDYILVSTAGSGIYMLKNGKIVSNRREKDGMSSDACLRLKKLDDSTVFVATARGVTKINYHTLDSTNLEITAYGGRNAKTALHVNALFIEKDHIGFGSNNGYYSFKINDLETQKTPPLIRLSEPHFFISYPDSVLRLDRTWFSRVSELRFVARGVAFLNGESVRYRYRLYHNGVLENNDSLTASNQYILTFLDLEGGDYLFEVECHRGDGIWSKPIQSRFNVGHKLTTHPMAIALYALLAGIGIYYLTRWRLRTREHAARAMMLAREDKLQLERRQLEWEQEAVRARVDPHFIFNALNGIMTFVYRRDFEAVIGHLPRLARLIRQSLQLGNEDFIDIKTEMSYLNDYLSLEKMRFENKFDFTVRDTEGVLPNEKVPPLLIQIFVENAVKHGIAGLIDEQKGFVEVVFSKSETDNALVCRITDNGNGISQTMLEKNAVTPHSEEHISMGLTIARRRMELMNQLYDKKYRLNIGDTEGGQGTTVELVFAE